MVVSLSVLLLFLFGDSPAPGEEICCARQGDGRAPGARGPSVDGSPSVTWNIALIDVLVMNNETHCQHCW